VSDRFEIVDTPLPQLMLVRRKPIGDSRGYLERLFCADELKAVMGDKGIKQVNRTLTVKRGTVRGMHFQYPPHSELKLVSCLRGEVFDVAVDVREGSATFLHWHGETLSGANHKALLIPEGFAHGFQTLTDDCEMLYFHTASYQPGAEGALNARDPALAIDWPQPISELSPRDAAHPLLQDEFHGVAP